MEAGTSVSVVVLGLKEMIGRRARAVETLRVPTRRVEMGLPYPGEQAGAVKVLVWHLQVEAAWE